jgi:hypothetical protein
MNLRPMLLSSSISRLTLEARVRSSRNSPPAGSDPSLSTATANGGLQEETALYIAAGSAAAPSKTAPRPIPSGRRQDETGSLHSQVKPGLLNLNLDILTLVMGFLERVRWQEQLPPKKTRDQDKTRQDKDNTTQHNTRHDKTRQRKNTTRQDKTRQDNTREDKISFLVGEGKASQRQQDSPRRAHQSNCPSCLFLVFSCRVFSCRVFSLSCPLLSCLVLPLSCPVFALVLSCLCLGPCPSRYN